MKVIYHIAKTELQLLFYSPVAWFVLIMFSIQSGSMFANNIAGLVEAQEMGRQMSGITNALFVSPFGGIFTGMQGHLYLYIPLLTMGLVSRELSSKSIQLLYSSPVTNFQIIMGKYLSMMIYGLVMMGILFLMVLCAWPIVEEFNIGMVLTGLLGLYLLLCAYAAVGIFMSSLTSYQIVAALSTFAVLTLLSMVQRWGQEYDIVRDITYWLGISGRSSQFIRGLICSEDVLYFILVPGLFLALTIIRLNAVRQKIRFSITFGRNIGVILLVCFGGYITSLPAMKVYYDATTTKVNTLTPNSQDIVKKLGDTKVTITSYNNVLATNGYSHSSYYFLKPDMERFEQYLRFKPDIKLEYVNYYDDVPNPQWDNKYKGKTLREKFVEVCKVCKLDTNRFITPEEIKQQIDLSEDGKYKVYGANGIIGYYSSYNHENSEIAMACRGNSCGIINRTFPKSWITGNAMVIKIRNPQVHNEYIKHALSYANVKGAISGSGQPQLTRENLSSIKFILPSSAILEDFSKKVEALVSMELEIERQKDELSKLRNEILPLLMNGQASLNYHLSND